jgi:hypothetical protein
VPTDIIGGNIIVEEGMVKSALRKSSRALSNSWVKSG